MQRLLADVGRLTHDTQNWQWQSLDYRRRVHRRTQAAPSQVHHLLTRNWSLTDGKPTTACQRDWHFWHQTDPTSHSPPRNAAAQSGKQRADLTRPKRIGRYLLHTPRAVWEFPLQNEESIVKIDGLSDADAVGCPNTRRTTSGGRLRVGQHTLATWS